MGLIIRLWFLSSVLLLINIYVCTKLNFNLFSTFQDMARISNHCEKKMVMGDNSVIIQSRINVLVHCPSSHCNLSIHQVSFQSLLYFPRLARTGNIMKRSQLKRDNSINIHGRIMVPVHCTSLHCHLSINQALFKCHQQF